MIVINLLNANAIVSQKSGKTLTNATSDQFEIQLIADVRWDFGKGSCIGHGTKDYFDADLVWVMWVIV